MIRERSARRNADQRDVTSLWSGLELGKRCRSSYVKAIAGESSGSGFLMVNLIIESLCDVRAVTNRQDLITLDFGV